MRRRVHHRRNERGGAAVELMFSAPVLLLCLVAMFDFGRGFRSKQEGERAARHLAWADTRSREDSRQPKPGSTSQHYRSKGSTAGQSVRRGTEQKFSGVRGAGYAALSRLEGVFGLRKVTRGALAFLGGEVEYSEAETAFRPSGLLLFTGGTVRSRHAVSIDSKREKDPRNPEGWWDPFSGEGGVVDRLPAWLRSAWGGR